MSDPIISVRGVGKEYRLGERGGADSLRDTVAGWFRRDAAVSKTASDRFWALRDISFDVAEGEVLGVIGANGAGKSTLLKILSRITEPTTGEVELRGRVASLLEVGTGFNDELTGRENIILNGAILGMSKRDIDQRYNEIIDFSGVEKFIDTPVKRYSSGMKMRLAFAVAAHLEPDILIIDEVLAVGDAEFQSKCLGKMGEVANSGRTVLFVSHNMAAVEGLCSRGVVLEGGQLVFSGSAQAATQHYRTNLESKQPRGPNNPWLQECSFGSSIGDSAAVRMGSAFTLRLALTTPSATRRPKVGVVLKNASTSAPVFDINTEILGTRLPAAAHTRFQCTLKFENVPLMPGEYLAEVWLGMDGQTYAVVRDAALLRVVDSDIYGTGKLPAAHLGTIFVKPSIELEPILTASD